jgi:hypothetical protein
MILDDEVDARVRPHVVHLELAEKASETITTRIATRGEEAQIVAMSENDHSLHDRVAASPLPKDVLMACRQIIDHPWSAEQPMAIQSVFP